MSLANMEDKESNLWQSERIIKLRVIPGERALTNTGLVDKRLFTGENTLRAKMDHLCLWSVAYDNGILPQALKQKFTSFSRLRNYLTEYFGRRNIEITEVINANVTTN